jgi:hypothetical protein
MVEVGITTFLASNSKRLWHRFPIMVGTQTLLNVPHAKKEAKALKDLILCIGKAIKHDPKGVVQSHLKSVGLVHPTQPQIDPQEDIFQGSLSFEEVLIRIKDEIEREKLHLVEEEKGK